LTRPLVPYDTAVKSIHVRDIPERTLQRLKQRAKRHHRSSQGELHAILEVAAGLPAPEETDGFRLVTVSVGRKGWSRDEIYGDDAR
jgi:plasmid stability protein